MKLSNVLLTAMLTSVCASQAQDSIIKTDLDSLHISRLQNNVTEIPIDSVLLKKIDSLYASRNKKKPKKYTKQKTATPTVERPHFYCPGCGRG